MMASDYSKSHGFKAIDFSNSWATIGTNAKAGIQTLIRHEIKFSFYLYNLWSNAVEYIQPICLCDPIDWDRNSQIFPEIEPEIHTYLWWQTFVKISCYKMFRNYQQTCSESLKERSICEQRAKNYNWIAIQWMNASVLQLWASEITIDSLIDSKRFVVCEKNFCNITQNLLRKSVFSKRTSDVTWFPNDILW